MNLAFVYLQAQGGFDGSFMIMMVAIFAIMYFFMIRPQNKKQKEIQNFRNNLQMGQDVITAGGIYGKVKSIEGNVVTFYLDGRYVHEEILSEEYADMSAQLGMDYWTPNEAPIEIPFSISGEISE